MNLDALKVQIIENLKSQGIRVRVKKFSLMFAVRMDSEPNTENRLKVESVLNDLHFTNVLGGPVSGAWVQAHEVHAYKPGVVCDF